VKKEPRFVLDMSEPNCVFLADMETGATVGKVFEFSKRGEWCTVGTYDLTEAPIFGVARSEFLPGSLAKIYFEIRADDIEVIR
jgi:hypothetical protein